MRLKRLPYQVKRALALYTNFYLRRRAPVIVYSTGRVGSMALYHSLDRRGAFVVQAHTMDPERLKVDTLSRSPWWVYRHVIRRGKATKIISPVRNPVALVMADFFTKLRWVTGVEKAYETLSVEALCDLFNTRYFDQGRHTQRLNWFDDEMKAWLGIDVYAHPFPKDEGYARFQHGPFDALLLRTELDDAVKARVVGEFAGLTDFEVIRYNVGEDKAYGDAYKAFKETVVIPEAHRAAIYSARYTQHFFTREALDAMNARWFADAPISAERRV